MNSKYFFISDKIYVEHLESHKFVDDNFKFVYRSFIGRNLVYLTTKKKANWKISKNTRATYFNQ